MNAVPVPRKEPRALLVDIDNTLYAYEPCHQAGMESAACLAAGLAGRWRDRENFSREFSRARTAVKHRLGRCAAAHSRLLYFKEMVDAGSEHAGVETAARLENAYWSAYGQQMRAEPDAHELLVELRNSGVLVAWVSNYTTARQIWKLRLLGFCHHRALLVTSEEAGSEKPDPGVVDLALQRLGVGPDETWYVGDSLEEDVAAARARNILPILLDRAAGGEMSDGHHIPVRNWKEIRRLFEA